MRSCPFWLMMVSRAMAVLPVKRSPMISSRWPRPIGIMPSMDLMPVCTGWLTACRTTTFGATISMGRMPSVCTEPLPSSGSPSGFTTRPRSASPTGTRAISPVALTRSPSFTPVSEPMTAAPTRSSSRFSARPARPLGNSSSSPKPTLLRPWMVAMPSPTSTTVPTSVRVVSPPNSSICRLSTAVMSCPRVVMPAPPFHAPSGGGPGVPGSGADRSGGSARSH